MTLRGSRKPRFNLESRLKGVSRLEKLTSSQAHKLAHQLSLRCLVRVNGLAALHYMRTCHVQYVQVLKKLVTQVTRPYTGIPREVHGRCLHAAHHGTRAVDHHSHPRCTRGDSWAVWW